MLRVQRECVLVDGSQGLFGVVIRYDELHHPPSTSTILLEVERMQGRNAQRRFAYA